VPGISWITYTIALSFMLDNIEINVYIVNQKVEDGL